MANHLKKNQKLKTDVFKENFLQKYHRKKKPWQHYCKCCDKCLTSGLIIFEILPIIIIHIQEKIGEDYYCKSCWNEIIKRSRKS